MESEATKLIKLLWQQQELIDYLLENRIAETNLPDNLDFNKIINELEVKLLKLALEKTDKNYKRSAKMLNLERSTFIAKLQRFNIYEKKNHSTKIKE